MCLVKLTQVGGESDEERFLNNLYRLPHAGAEWQEMPQKLKTGRNRHVAFMVPDHITDCNIP